MSIEIRLLRQGDEAVLERIADDVFDELVDEQLAREFLGSDGHYLAVAVDAGRVVGFASGVTYVHPDKPRELWVNEVGVAESHQRRGIATQLIRKLFNAAREAGCQEAWVLTERPNEAANGLYRSLGGVEPGDETVMYSFRLEASLNDDSST